jgi:hypothetical protein
MTWGWRWGVGGWGGEESRLLYFLHTSRNIPCKHGRICCNVRNKVRIVYIQKITVPVKEISMTVFEGM